MSVNVILFQRTVCCCRGEELCVLPEPTPRLAADNRDNSSSGWEMAGDLDIDSTQVTDLDVSSDGGAPGGVGNQQRSPHHHHHLDHQTSSSHINHSQASTSLHHIDRITGITATGSQFHPPLVQQSHSAATVSPQAELVRSAASP